MFREATTADQHIFLEEYADSVIGYKEKCIEDVIAVKTIIICANQKPCLMVEVHALLKAKDAAFRSEDKKALGSAWAEISKYIGNLNISRQRRSTTTSVILKTLGTYGRASRP